MTDPAANISFSSVGADRKLVNGALSGSRNQTCTTLIGLPRGTFNQDCQPVTVPAFEAKLVRNEDVGPFDVTGLRPAVEALKSIFSEVKTANPDTYKRLVTAGMLCCRHVRGSTTVVSNHAFGIAVDIGIDNIDTWGDGLTQKGLWDIHGIFNAHGFFWGAAFPKEDSMHFEASDQLIQKWAAEGVLGAGELPSVAPGLRFGDRGYQVVNLQEALNAALPLAIAVDGLFGKDTRAAVMEFQRENGMPVTGVAGKTVRKALGLSF